MFHEDCNHRHQLPFNIKPNVITYAKGSNPAGRTDSQHTELIIEFKWSQCDNPFGDVYESEKTDKSATRSFVLDTSRGYDTLGQITGYAMAQHGA